ncbi:hypothetical protein CJJ07_003835 [Candidozyma auris]|nr:hypothetical protein CJJ07_003835 [[Candida] auris]QEL61770.1 hypothetical protein CJJ09_003926 [[Candida] auris]
MPDTLVGARPKDEEELELEKLVFGDNAGFEANLRKIENLYDSSEDEQEGGESDVQESGSEEEQFDDDDMFFIDDGGDEGTVFEAPVKDEDGMDVDDEEEEAVWHDSDDEKHTISVISDRSKKLRQSYVETALSAPAYVARLRAQFERIYPRPSWADEATPKGEGDSDDEALDEDDDSTGDVGKNIRGLAQLLSSNAKYVKSKTALLTPTKISISRLKDANIARKAQGPVMAMSFHPSHPLLLTGGMDKTLRIFNIDGRTNKLVSSTYFKDVPIRSCQFSPDPTSTLVYASGRRRYMSRWDTTTEAVEKVSRMYGQEETQRSFEYFKMSPRGTFVALLGSNGYVNLLNSRTTQLFRAYKVDGYVADFEFTKDERTLIVANFAGDVWEFALNSPDVDIVNRWSDTSAVAVTKIALGGPADRWLAIGTKSGMVNLFDRTTFNTLSRGQNPKPFRSVGNLVTQVFEAKFSPDGQILCVASKQKKDALKLVHMPSGTVFANWPTGNTPLGRVTCVQFSPNSQMLAIANDAGKITLWRLNHY